MSAIRNKLQELKKIPSDIYEHLDTLYNLAKECDHITEFGTRHGLNTAIREFLDQNTEWKIKNHYKNNNGLTVLEELV